MRLSLRVLAGLVVGALVLPGTALGARPTPSITTTMAFAADCTYASVQISWTDWRTTQIVLALESPVGTTLQIAGTPVRRVMNAPTDFRALRDGPGVLHRFYASTYGLTDWTGYTLTGFGAASNNRGTAIVDRDPDATGVTCVAT